MKCPCDASRRRSMSFGPAGRCCAMPRHTTVRRPRFRVDSADKLTRPEPSGYTGDFGKLPLTPLMASAMVLAARGPPDQPANVNPADVRLDVNLGRLHLANPIAVASGTFGYARKWPAWSIRPPRRHSAENDHPEPPGRQPPPRTVETAAGLLNSIGLDNDGIDGSSRGTCPIWRPGDEDHREHCREEPAGIRRNGRPAGRPARRRRLELNISCPNVSGGVDFGTDPAPCEAVTAGVRQACNLPLIVKLTPNVTNIAKSPRPPKPAGPTRSL